MTDTETIEFLQQRIRRLEQLVCDGERVIEDHDHANDRQKRELENLRRRAIIVADYERPEVVAQILAHSLCGWPRARWHALADLLLSRF